MSRLKAAPLQRAAGAERWRERWRSGAVCPRHGSQRGKGPGAGAAPGLSGLVSAGAGGTHKL